LSAFEPVNAAEPARDGALRAAELIFDRVTKTYPGRKQPALKDFSLRIKAAEICVLVGPSGGGKTTALRMVNRLIDYDSGDITLDGRSIRDVPPIELRRHIGYVIQQTGLFPHMSVRANIAAVPKLLNWNRKRINDRVDELLALVGLTDEDGKRYPAALSGGQKQRVGLARALAVDPPIMLMDEPFGALDPITRLRMQDEFLRLHRSVGKTVVLVTHDVDEAMKMGDTVAILGPNAKLVQHGPPDEILANPEADFVAEFIGGDRALRRLALRRIDQLSLRDAADAPAHLPAMTADNCLREALSVMLERGVDAVRIEDPAGMSRGLLTRAMIDGALDTPATATAARR